MLSVIKQPDSPIYLKPLDVMDTDFFYQIYGDSEIMHFIGKPLTRAQANKQLIETVKIMSDVNPHHLTYVIRCSRTDNNMGITGLTWFKSDNREVAAVGVMILPEYRRKKMAHQAKIMMINNAFNQCGVEKIYAYCQIDNVAANTANMRLKLQKGRRIDAGVNRQLSQEWFIDKSGWIESYSDQN